MFGGHAVEDMGSVRLRQRQGADVEGDYVDAVGRPGKDGDLMPIAEMIGRFTPDPPR
jgi:hypothetical protein